LQALYHWDYGADARFGEVDYNTGALQLRYWVDYWLGQEFSPTAGAQLLQYTSTDAEAVIQGGELRRTIWSTTEGTEAVGKDLRYGLIILRPRPELGNLKMSITTYGK